MIPIIALVISAITLALAIFALIVKISSFATEQRMRGEEHKKELDTIGKDIKTVKGVLKRVPLIEFRVGYIEKHLELSVPAMPGGDHDAEE